MPPGEGYSMGSGQFRVAVMGIAIVVLACAQLSASEDPYIGIESLDPAKGPVSGTVPIKVWFEEDIEFQKVEYFVDGESIGEDTSKPFSLDWDTTKVEDGEHTVQVKGTVDDGKTKESKPVVIEVDNN
jgi:hypothetical protein